MKKILLIITCILLLCGCSNNRKSVVENGDEVLFEIGKTKYTKDDLYYDMLASAGSGSVLSELQNKIIEIDNIDTQSIKDDAEEYYNYIAQYGDDYVEQYGGKDAIIEMYMNYYIGDAITKNYINNNFDKYASENTPKQIQYVSFENEEDAKTLIKNVKEGNNFDAAAYDLGYTQDCTPVVYTATDLSNLNAQVSEYCTNTTSTGLSDVIVSSTTSTDEDGNEVSTPIYYVVNIVSVNPNDFKDDFMTLLINEGLVDPTEALNNAISQHEVNIYVQSIYDELSAQFESLVK